MKGNLFRPYDAESRLGLCRCGLHHDSSACDAAAVEPQQRAGDEEALSQDFIEAAAVHALFPHEPTRRAFLKAVGAGTAMAAISSVLPLESLQAMAAETKTAGNLEKKNLNIGFIPITCATPLIMADPMGFYAKQGLNVTLNKVAGWALVRDRMLNRELDASHFLAPMPLAISMGLGSAPQNMEVASIQNINGQALTMSLKHINNRNPKNWKGMVFAIPFEHSMHNYLLRYFLAEHGLDPDRDVQLRLTSPADMIANLRAGNIDGFFGPEHLPRALPRYFERHGSGQPKRKPPRNRACHFRPQLPQPTRNRGAPSVDRPLRRRRGQGAGLPRPHRLRCFAVVFVCRVDAHADEALGLCERQCRLPPAGRKSLHAYRCPKTDARIGAERARAQCLRRLQCDG